MQQLTMRLSGLVHDFQKAPELAAEFTACSWRWTYNGEIDVEELQYFFSLLYWKINKNRHNEESLGHKKMRASASV